MNWFIFWAVIVPFAISGAVVWLLWRGAEDACAVEDEDWDW